MDGSTNGHSADGMAMPRKTVVFRIGEEDLAVPSLKFQDMDDVKDSMRAMTPELYWLDYAGHVLRVVAHQMTIVAGRPDLTFEVLRERCTAGEATKLAGQMNELLWASGFPRPPETPAETLGTGILISSAPDLQPETSAEAIQAS